jgi:hypothetical protein
MWFGGNWRVGGCAVGTTANRFEDLRACLLTLIERRVYFVFRFVSLGMYFPRQGWRGATVNVGQKNFALEGLYINNFGIYV